MNDSEYSEGEAGAAHKVRVTSVSQIEQQLEIAH